MEPIPQRFEEGLRRLSERKMYSHYTYSRNEEKKVLIIIDQFNEIKDHFQFDRPTMTVTNNVEEVLEEISQEIGLLNDWSIIYRDTEGDFDLIEHTNGIFDRFTCLQAKTSEEAIQQLERMQESN